MRWLCTAGPPGRSGPLPSGGRGATGPLGISRGGPPPPGTKGPPPPGSKPPTTQRGVPPSAASHQQVLVRAAPPASRTGGGPPQAPPAQVRPPPGATQLGSAAGRAVYRADGRGGVAPPGAGRPNPGVVQAVKGLTIGSSGTAPARGKIKFVILQLFKMLNFTSTLVDFRKRSLDWPRCLPRSSGTAIGHFENTPRVPRGQTGTIRRLGTDHL